jgi:hypothetical protein
LLAQRVPAVENAFLYDPPYCGRTTWIMEGLSVAIISRLSAREDMV